MSQLVDISLMRNVGIMAHIDAGKTTTTERMLFYSGVVHKIGDVDDGTTVTDYMQQERERGITIVSAAITFPWKDCQVNLIDTPGHVDFTAEVQRSLRVLDGVVAVFCGVAGVQPQSETVWRQADMYSVPRIAYINKMDRIGANFDNAVQSIREKLQALAVPIQIPIGSAENFEGVIDLIRRKAIYFEEASHGVMVIEKEPPSQFEEIVAIRRNELIEALADCSDVIMTKYLESSEITENEIIVALRKATLSNTFVPVLCGSSFKNKGVQPLLDAVVKYLPSPLDRGKTIGYEAYDSHEFFERNPDPKDTFSGLVFKIITDPFVGRLSFVRIYSGTIHVGDKALNSAVGKQERIGKILRIAANKREEIQTAGAGDIIAIPGLRFSRTGDTLCDIEKPIIYEQIQFAEPVINQSIEPRSSADQDKLVDSLAKLSEEDPTFKFGVDPESGQTIISGVGELHLEIIVDRLQREFNVQARVGKPQVAFRETVTQTVRQEGVFDRSSAPGKSQFASLTATVSPNERGQGNKVVLAEDLSSKLPIQFHDSIRQSCLDALNVGPVFGYPLVDVIVSVVSGEYREGDSTELAFKIASSIAVRDACRLASAMVLEPIFTVQVAIPEEYVGEVIADISMRRGKIEGIHQQRTFQIVEASVPLSEMFGYVTQLRSLTQGRGSYMMKFFGYDLKP